MKKNMFDWKLAGLAGLLILLLAACSSPQPTAVPKVDQPAPVQEEPTAVPEAAVEPAAEPTGEQPQISQPIYRWGAVADQVWVLVGYDDALNPTVVKEGTVITAVFSSVDNQLSGSGGCNNYFTSYESTDDGGLTINGPIGSTMMACENLDTESAYFAALEAVNGWSLNEEGRLELTYDTGQPYEQKLIFTPGETPLTGPLWRLVTMGDPDNLTEVLPGTTVTAEFQPDTGATGSVGGSATCNNYNTSYTIDGDQISFGPVMGTMMFCPIGADQEAAYLAALESAQTFQIIGPNMQITYDGGVLNFTSLNLPLENVLWQALAVGGEPVPEGVQITALFVPGEEAGSGTLGGNAGCNNYNTSYETSSDISVNPPVHSLTVGSPMAMTLSICPDEALAALEQTYLGALESAATYEILGEQMILHSAAGNVLFAADREPLLGTMWSLVSLGDLNNPQPPAEGSAFTATFSRLPTLPTGTVTGETGCNDYNATFAADLTAIKINLPQKSNNEDCPWGAGDFVIEQQYFLGLNAATSYRILGNTLQLLSGAGDAQQVMNFEATQPAVEEALDLAPLNGTFWYLSAFDDQTILPGTKITADFTINEDGVTGAVSGAGGCNAYNAPIGLNFAIGPIASTQKACSQSVTAQESAYFTWLESAYGFDRAGDQLLVSTANGILTFNSTPIQDQTLELQNVTWYIVSYEALNAIPGSNPTAVFNADGTTLSGSTGCNQYSGAYKTEQSNKLTISGFSSTLAACASEALTTQEATFLRLMPAAVSYLVSGSQLQITTVDGGTMNFTSVPPQAPPGPTAVIVSENLSEVGQTINFDGSQSTAGGTPIVSFSWQMGDGTNLTGPYVQHAYNSAGTKTVRLTVVDQAGQSNSTQKSVQISAVVQVVAPTAVIEGPASAFVGETVSFSAAGSQPGTAAISSYSWTSGDGNQSGSVPFDSFTTIYSQPGTYYPSVTVSDAGGLSDSAGMAITINATLAGSQWILSPTIPGTSITLSFANGSMSGFAGCNTYNASYTTTLAAGNTNNISVGPIISTGALCSEEIMNQEQGYFSSLQTANSYTISGTGLTLTTADGQLTYFAAIPTPFTALPAAQ